MRRTNFVRRTHHTRGSFAQTSFPTRHTMDPSQTVKSEESSNTAHRQSSPLESEFSAPTAPAPTSDDGPATRTPVAPDSDADTIPTREDVPNTFTPAVTFRDDRAWARSVLAQKPLVHDRDKPSGERDIFTSLVSDFQGTLLQRLDELEERQLRQDSALETVAITATRSADGFRHLADAIREVQLTLVQLARPVSASAPSTLQPPYLSGYPHPTAPPIFSDTDTKTKTPEPGSEPRPPPTVDVFISHLEQAEPTPPDFSKERQTAQPITVPIPAASAPVTRSPPGPAEATADLIAAALRIPRHTVNTLRCPQLQDLRQRVVEQFLRDFDHYNASLADANAPLQTLFTAIPATLHDALYAIAKDYKVDLPDMANINLSQSQGTDPFLPEAPNTATPHTDAARARPTPVRNWGEEPNPLFNQNRYTTLVHCWNIACRQLLEKIRGTGTALNSKLPSS